ncbi:MAG: exonuclease SbcCD subunit D [Deltaproteobacteria bacterium]|nr:exonuclease SbcCD subunit D [Deltaproteobacteria bacterium]
MRFIHTADWHLGRLFHGVHLTDDQAHVLEQLVRLAAEEKADALIVAGDVYDRAVPPPEAVSLLDEVVSKLVLDHHVPVVIIAGNHDGPDRLAFGSRILAERGLHVLGTPTATPAPIRFTDRHGVVEVFSAPFADPATYRACLARDDLHDHDTALSAWLTVARAARNPLARSVLVGHAFVRGGAESESERPLSVGGAGAVDVARLAGFAYVALGHLHRPQALCEDGSIAYSGSLLKYSFSEEDHPKSVSVVEIDGRGRAKVERVALTPRRDLRTLEGHLAELLVGRTATGPVSGSREDYFRIRLLDTGTLLDPMGKLRAVYPNVLALERPEVEGLAAPGASGAARDRRKLGDLELFEAFAREVGGAELGAEERALLTEVLTRLDRDERESAATEDSDAP